MVRNGMTAPRERRPILRWGRFVAHVALELGVANARWGGSDPSLRFIATPAGGLGLSLLVRGMQHLRQT